MAISDDLAAFIVTREFQLLRVAAGLQKEALSTLEELEADLIDRINRAAGKSDLTQARLKALLDQTERSISKAYKDLAAQNSEDMGTIANTEAHATAEFINMELSANIMTVAASDEQLQTVADKTLILGRYGKDLWEQQGQATQDRFAAQMRLGMLSGESVDQMIARVRGTRAMGYADGVMAASRRHAETLVRTSVISVANESRLQMYKNNSDVVKGIQWVATLDSRTTLICRALDGLMWDLDYNPIGHNKAWPGPTAHINCFTEETPVASPSKASLLYRRSYSGELITVETDNGRKITGTPNHPILTPSGWMALGKIGISTNLVCQKRRGASPSGHPKNQGRVTTFGKLFKTTAKLSGMLPMQMPIAAPDFHGDGTDGEICQVWAYGSLSDKVNSSIGHILGEGDFDRPNKKRTISAFRFVPLYNIFSRTLHAANSIMSRIHAWLFASRPSGVQILGSSASDPGSNRPSAESVNADFKFPTNFAGRDLIGDIEVDRVRVIRRRKAVSVFVHNLETESGWYLADGIVSHNCRSTQISVLKSWQELADEGDMSGPRGGASDIESEIDREAQAKQWTAEQTEARKNKSRASMNGQVAANFNYDDWLRSLTKPENMGKTRGEAFQNKVLGPGRADLWRDGKVTLQEMTNQNNRPLTVEQLKSK